MTAAERKNCPFCEGARTGRPGDLGGPAGGRLSDYTRLAGARRPQPLRGPEPDPRGPWAASGRDRRRHRRWRSPACRDPRNRARSVPCLSPAGGFHEVIIHSPTHHASLGGLDDGELASMVAGRRRRVPRARGGVGLRPADRQRGARGGGRPFELVRPAHRARVRPGGDRPRARALVSTASTRWAATCSGSRSPPRRCAAASAWWRSTTRPC